MNYEMAGRIDEIIRQRHYRLVNSVVVYENDERIVENYYNHCDENSRHNIKSIWKSILSICVGICLKNGYIKSLDEPVSEYVSAFSRNIHPYHKLITIRNLLTMTSGIYWNGGVHYHCPMLEQLWRTRDWAAHLTDIAMADVPGTRFAYKEWDVILLSAVIGAASGMGAYDFCDQYLYKPLAIKSGEWAKSPCGISYTIIPGKEGSSDLTARDLAKLGMLFLKKGCWNGKEIMSREYVEHAISPSGTNAQYGYLWWLFNGFYGCRGYGGQEVNALPSKAVVAVVQANATPRSKSYGDIFIEGIKDFFVH